MPLTSVPAQFGSKWKIHPKQAALASPAINADLELNTSREKVGSDGDSTFELANGLRSVILHSVNRSLPIYPVPPGQVVPLSDNKSDCGVAVTGV